MIFIILLIIIDSFFFVETYNVIIYEKHGEDSFTHPLHNPQLQLEAGVINKPARNQVYGMPMTLTREMWSDHTALTLDTQQSNPS